jgi:hypothetical protein
MNSFPPQVVADNNRTFNPHDQERAGQRSRRSRPKRSSAKADVTASGDAIARFSFSHRAKSN